MFKAFIFDLDGTLVDSEEYHCQCYQQVFFSLGGDLSENEYIKYWLTDGMKGMSDCLKEKGLKVDWESARMSKQRIFFENIPQKFQLMPGVMNFLEYAQKTKITCIVASGSRSAEIKEILKRAGIEHFFSAILGLDNVSRSKPDPEMFLKAAAAAKADLQDCLVFENSINGLIAAKNAGLKCLTIPSRMTLQQNFEISDKILTSFDQITPEVLEEIWKNPFAS